MNMLNSNNLDIVGTQGAYRLTSLTRLPGKGGRGVANIATLFHDTGVLEVSWQSSLVDSRLKRGCYVAIRGLVQQRVPGATCKIQNLDLIDRPQASVNPFETIPPTWVKDRALVQRASFLWKQLSRPFQHLVNAVLWDGARMERFVSGPTTESAYPPFPNANLRHAVETAEEGLNLAEGLPNVSRSVLITAALLHDVGKADNFQRKADGEGYTYSARGALVGHHYTILEWLAVARSCDGVVIPDDSYLALIHALTATYGTVELSLRLPRTIEASLLAVADRISSNAELLTGNSGSTCNVEHRFPAQR